MRANISSASDPDLGKSQSALLIQLAEALLRAAGVPAQKTNAEPTLIPITKPKELLHAGIAHPRTYRGWQWAYRQRKQRGLERAFVKAGSRVLVDVEAYLEAMRAQHAWFTGQPSGRR